MKYPRTPEYRSWDSMIQRCSNPKRKSFKYYGALGIKVCPRWMKAANFIEDMGSKPSPAHTLDRKDNERDYCPENCRWATCSQQNRNRRDTRMLVFRGVTKSLADWAELFNLIPSTLKTRLRRGRWSVEKALTTPKFPTANRKHKQQ